MVKSLMKLQRSCNYHQGSQRRESVPYLRALSLTFLSHITSGINRYGDYSWY